MSELFARPLKPYAEGFYFDSAESYQRQVKEVHDRSGNRVEKFDILFIKGERIDEILLYALDIQPGTIGLYFDAVDNWSDDEKIRVIAAVEECGCTFGPDSRPGDFNIDLYKVDSLQDLARHVADNARFNKVLKNIRDYLDMEAIIRDLGPDYADMYIAGHYYIYRCG